MKTKFSGRKKILGGIAAVLMVILVLFAARDTEPPVITTNDQTVAYGTTLSYAELAAVEDNRSKEIDVTASSVKTSGLTIDDEKQAISFDDTGDYEIEIVALDQAENESRDTVKICVIDAIAPEIVSVDSQVDVGYNNTLKLLVNDTAENAVSIQVNDKTATTVAINRVQDSDGKDLSSGLYEIKENGTDVVFSELGEYKLVFAVTDEFENTTAGEVNVQVIDTTAPEIKGLEKAFTLKESDTQKTYLSKITAEDEIDGDLTKKIEIDDSAVKYGKPGEYTAYAKVSDKGENTTQQEFSIVIKDTTAPVLSLSKASFTLTEGDSAPDYEDVVSAKDAVDGDITKSIEINDSKVNYDSAGTYTVVCKVTDSSGNTTTKNISVKVKAESRSTTYDSSSSGSSGSSGGGSSGSSSGGSSGSSGGTVLITRTGECYHTHKCGNGTYFAVSYEEAISRGLRPCKKCY